MAVDVPLLTDRHVTAFKIETTTGTAISLSGTDATANVYDPSIEPDIAVADRQGQSSLSPLTGVSGGQKANVSLKTWLVGLGSVGVPPEGDLFLAAGFTLTSQAYTVSTANINTTTLTMGYYEDGMIYSVSGVKVDCTMRGQTGGPVVCEWRGMGRWIAPTTGALLTPTYKTTIPPTLKSATLTIGGTAYKVSNFELALGNQVVMREDITDSTGYHAAAITKRKVTFKIDPERSTTKNWYTDLTGNVEAALNLVIGSASNNTITITAPKLQLTRVVPGDRNGIRVDQLEFQSNRSASAGDDELVVTFS